MTNRNERIIDPVVINRRNFIQQTCVLASSAFIGLSSFSSFKKPKYKMGLQLYTIRDAMAKDPVATLKTIASFGYEDLETFGYDGAQSQYYGFKSKEFKHILDDNNLTTSSGHYDFFLFLHKPEDSLRAYVDQCMEGAHALNQKYITWPWLDPQSRTIEDFKKVAEKLNLIGERVKKAGLGLAYHNHDFEFIPQNGQIGYDIIIQETDPTLVKLELDIYWAIHSSKLSPHELFKLQPGRFVMWHIKDMDKINRDFYTEVGNGSIDFTKIMPDAQLSGLEYYFVEQGDNFKIDPIQSVKQSARYVKSHLE